MRTDKAAFTIGHYEPVLLGTVPTPGANMIVNGDFETGDMTGWGTTTNWSVIASTSATPPGRHAYCARASSGSGGITSTLLSDRYAVTAGNTYYWAFNFGAGGQRANNTLTVNLRWYNNSVGGALQGTSSIMAAPVSPNSVNLQGWNGHAKAPGGATHVYFEFINNSNANLDSTSGVVLDYVMLAPEVTVNKPRLLETLAYRGSRWRTAEFSDLIYSTHFRSGHKTLTFNLRGDPEYLRWWLEQCLGDHIELYFENRQVWNGMVWDIDGNIDGHGKYTSYDSIANAIRVNGNGGAAIAYDLDSQARYGKIRMIETDDSINYPMETTARANYLLAQHDKPLIGDSSATEKNMLTVTCQGYWSTLIFVESGAGFIAPTQTDTVAVIATSTDPPSILNLVWRKNPFIRNDYSRCLPSGIVVASGSQKDVPAGNPQSVIQRLLSYGDANFRQLISGVWEDRYFIVQPRSTSFDYIQEYDADGKLAYFDAGGARMPTPFLQAGRIMRKPRVAPNWVKPADAFYDQNCAFLIEAEYDCENDSWNLTTPQTNEADLLIHEVRHVVGKHMAGADGSLSDMRWVGGSGGSWD